MTSSNKRKGTYHEHWWVNILNLWGWQARRQPLSGQLADFPGDVEITVLNERLIVESKYQTNGKGWSFIHKILHKKTQGYERDVLVMTQRSGDAYLCVNINNDKALAILRRKLIGCETSGVVREAFIDQGHDAWSCDVLPSDVPTNKHIQDDVLNVLRSDSWDMLMVAHPPCTRLCNSGVRWLSKPPPNKTLKQMWNELEDGAKLFSELLNADVPRIAVENPVMHKHEKQRIENYQPFSQSIQPWQFGHGETKATCLWRTGLPPLTPTNVVEGREARVHKMTPSADRWKLRSATFRGIAAAMADQWGQP